VTQPLPPIYPHELATQQQVYRYAHGIESRPVWTVGELSALPRDLEVEGPVRFEHNRPLHPRMLCDRRAETYRWVRIGGGERGPILGFSRASRRRLLRQLGMVRTELMGQGWFVTLTYHLKMPDPEDTKRDLRALQDRLRRLDPDAGMIWRLEPQQRGAPHFHLLIWSNRLSEQWLRRAWTEIVDDTASEWHVWYGCRAEKIMSWKKLRAYCAKYVAKETHENLEWGRRWAVWGQVKMDPVNMAMLTREEAVNLKRIVRRLMRARERQRGESRRRSGRGVRVEWCNWIGWDSPATLWRAVEWVLEDP